MCLKRPTIRSLTSSKRVRNKHSGFGSRHRRTHTEEVSWDKPGDLSPGSKLLDPFLFGFMSLIVFSLLCARIRSQFIEKRRTMIAMGSPTQKMCMTMPMAIILKENGNFIAPESGTTTRFMKK